MANILHLSETFMSGYPTRLSELINKHSSKYRSRCITSQVQGEKFILDTDMKSFNMTKTEIEDRVRWADIIHYHGLHSISFLGKHGIECPPKGKIEVVQIYEHPEEELYNYEDPNQAIPAGMVCIICPRCSFAKWPAASFLALETPHFYGTLVGAYRAAPIVRMDAKYMPHIARWREITWPLREMEKSRQIMFITFSEKHHYYSVILKQGADIGVGDILEGKYNLSALDFAAAGVPCFCRVDSNTRKNLLKMTGTNTVPWIATDKDHFLFAFKRMVERKLWFEEGDKTKQWMETYWNADIILKHYTEAYDCL